MQNFQSKQPSGISNQCLANFITGFNNTILKNPIEFLNLGESLKNDLRIILFIILTLLIVYSAFGLYDELSPDSREALIDRSYQARSPLLVPYDTIILSRGKSTELNIALFNQAYLNGNFHLGLSCVDQYTPSKQGGFTLSHFPSHAHVPLGKAEVVSLTLAVPISARASTYFCRIELGHPEIGIPIIASKQFSLIILP